MSKWRLDPSDKEPYGTWCCEVCGFSFYGGGKALHKSTCTSSGYEACIYRATPKELKKVRKLGFNPTGPQLKEEDRIS